MLIVLSSGLRKMYLSCVMPFLATCHACKLLYCMIFLFLFEWQIKFSFSHSAALEYDRKEANGRGRITTGVTERTPGRWFLKLSLCFCILRTVAITPIRNERGSEIPSSDQSLKLLITYQTAAQTACGRIVLCSVLRSHSQRQYPADIRSRVDTTAVLLRPTRRTCMTYCTSPLRRTVHTE